MLKRKQVDLDAKSVAAMRAIMDDLRKLQTAHDGRLLAVALLDRAAIMYGHLRVLGYETDATIDEMFGFAIKRAKESTKQPTVAMLGDTPSSERPS